MPSGQDSALPIKSFIADQENDDSADDESRDDSDQRIE
jgi:hypothetical protein